MNIDLHSAGRLALRALGMAGIAAGAAIAIASPAHARSEVTPYIEVQQVLDADLNNGEVLTYSAVAAGVDASVTTRRVQAQISYRYERRIAWDDDLLEEDIHSGLAQARVQLVPNTVTLEAGAIAARSRIDNRGEAPGFTSADSANVAEVYGVYAGPTLSTHVGALAVNAGYRLGYVNVDDHGLSGGYGGPELGSYQSAVNHNATASVGMAPGGASPVGWTASAGYFREDTEQLEQRFEASYARGDVVVPVSQTLAVTGGVGYEKIEASQQDLARDANGNPVVTPDGELVGDPSRPRLLAYEQDGIIWDAGVIWRPNPRTELQARVGRRYGGTTYVGTLRYDIDSSYGLNAVVYDSVTSFGRSLISDISGLPVNFDIDRNGLNAGIGGVGGCVFGQDPGTGGCFDDTFQSISGNVYRNRGVSVVFSGRRGVWEMELGAGYARRRYLAPVGPGFALDGVVDEGATIQGSIGRSLTRTSGIDLDAYASWYGSELPGSDDVFSTGLTGTYYRTFLLDRLQGQASLGIYNTDTGTFDSTVASALLGLRYNF